MILKLHYSFRSVVSKEIKVRNVSAFEKSPKISTDFLYKYYNRRHKKLSKYPEIYGLVIFFHKVNFIISTLPTPK